MNDTFYYKYSDYLKQKYGTKVYKLPVNLPLTCPNRCGGQQGCTFCADIGTGFESLSNEISVQAQLLKNKAYIGSKYHVNKFIAYFQNYTNTYMPLDIFKSRMEEAAAVEDIVEIAVSTRPDCIKDSYLDFLEDLSSRTGIRIHIELGLQTVNYHTLDDICRGHGLAEFIDSVLRIHRHPFTVCAHLILNLPQDTIRDTIESSKIISVLPVDVVKLHSLYIARHSAMGRAYKQGQLQICSKEEYMERLKTFLEYLNPTIAVERLFSRIPEKDALFSNWQTSWWKLNDEFSKMMASCRSRQGIRYNYTNGPKL